MRREEERESFKEGEEWGDGRSEVEGVRQVEGRSHSRKERGGMEG